MQEIHFNKIDALNDQERLAIALDQAKRFKHEQVLIKFDKKTYNFEKDTAYTKIVHLSNTDSTQYPKKHIGMLLENLENVIFDGQGSLFQFHGNMMMFAMIESSNIEFRNMIFDYKISSTSEMSVSAYDTKQKWIEYYIPSSLNFEVKDKTLLWYSEKNKQGDYYWIEENDHQNYGIQVRYPHSEMGRSYFTEQNPFRYIETLSKIDNNRIRIKYEKMPEIKPVVGMCYQFLSNAKRETAGAFIFNSKNIKLENVQIAYMHGFGLLVQMSENVHFNSIKIKTRAITQRQTSSFADGIHVSGAKGHIIIENSEFDNTHDDPINIHGTFTRVEKKLDDRTLELAYVHNQQGGFTQFHPGDAVVFYSRTDLQSLNDSKRYTVETVLHQEDKSMIVRFEEPLPQNIDEKVGEEGLYVAENMTYTPKVAIKNNKFSHVFTRMILVSTNKEILIENNDFEPSTMASIFISNDSDEWYESGPVNDVVIRKNTFKVDSIGRTWWKYAPAIYFKPVTKGNQLPHYTTAIHNNILIEENTFYLRSDGVIRAESVGNLSFQKNKIFRLNPNIKISLPDSMLVTNQTEHKIPIKTYSDDFKGEVSLPSGPENNAGTTGNLFEFKACNKIKIVDNYYDEGLKPYVLIEDMPKESIVIEDDLKLVSKRDNYPVINDFKNIYYEIENPEILSIDQGILRPHLKGQTTIRACYLYGKEVVKSNKCSVRVN